MIQRAALAALQPQLLTTLTLPPPPLAGKDWPPGLIVVVQLGVLVTVVLAATGPLLDGAAVTVLLITVPLATPGSTWATSVTVSVTPGLIAAKVTVRLLPEPPQTPAPVAAHETKVVAPGRVSVSRMFWMGFGP